MKNRIFPVFALLVAACGSSEQEAPKSAPPAPPPTPAAAPARPTTTTIVLTPEQRKAGLERMWGWSAKAGKQRDVVADDAACNQKVKSDPKYPEASDYARFLAYGKCMVDLGWVLQSGKRGE